MRARDLHRYLNDVGWLQSPVPPDASPTDAPLAAGGSLDTLDALARSADRVMRSM